MNGHGIDDLTVDVVIGRDAGICLCLHVQEGPVSVYRVPGILSDTENEARAGWPPSVRYIALFGYFVTPYQLLRTSYHQVLTI
jgi:hypothetical protein